MQHKNTLIVFLRELAELVERDKISGSQLRCIGEFYMSYLFKEEVRRDNYGTSRTRSCKNRSSHSKKEMEKFIFLGWYVYNKILNNESL